MDDVVEAYLLATSVRARVGADLQPRHESTLREVVAVARRAMGIGAEPVWSTMPNRQWDANVWVSDNRKIRAQLNWQPQRTFAEGFRLMLDWFRYEPLPAYARKASEGVKKCQDTGNALKPPPVFLSIVKLLCDIFCPYPIFSHLLRENGLLRCFRAVQRRRTNAKGAKEQRRRVDEAGSFPRVKR